MVMWYNGTTVVMEEPAWRGASQDAVYAFAVLHFALTHNDRCDLKIVKPGNWKPLMTAWRKAHDLPDNLAGEHQEDAYLLATYYRLTQANKEVENVPA